MNSTEPVFAATARDGRVWVQYVEQRRGSPHHPLSRSEIKQQFRCSAASALGADAAEQLLGCVFDVENSDDARAITELLKAPVRAVSNRVRRRK